MSQFGMQVQGGARRRGSTPDVFTALAVLATVFLAVACVVMWGAASKVGAGGNAFSLQEPGKISLKDSGPAR